MNNNKNLVLIFSAVLIIILGVVFFMKSSPEEKGGGGLPSDMPTVASNTTPTVKPSESVKEVTQISISYADALVKYKDRRIQLDPSCRATPRTVTYKDNTGIMVDNRSDQARTVKIGTTFTIKPWGFKILVLPDTYRKSKTLLVDCDKSQNVATVLIQE